MKNRVKNLSDYPSSVKTHIPNMQIGIVVSEYHKEITSRLYHEAYNTLVKEGVPKRNIGSLLVPGAFELPSGVQQLASIVRVHAFICIGCVIQGETKHFDFICQAVAHGLTKVSLQQEKPVIFGVLTPNTYQEAFDRSGGKYGNKGTEAAIAAIKMILNKYSSY